jgi:hypothetical protein
MEEGEKEMHTSFDSSPAAPRRFAALPRPCRPLRHLLVCRDGKGHRGGRWKRELLGLGEGARGVAVGGSSRGRWRVLEGRGEGDERCGGDGLQR